MKTYFTITFKYETLPKYQLFTFYFLYLYESKIKNLLYFEDKFAVNID